MSQPDDIYAAEVNTLGRMIRATFPVGSPPARIATPHSSYDCARAINLLGGRSWIDVADSFPVDCHDSFPILSQEAKQYYLPAWMIASLTPQVILQGTSLEFALKDGTLMPEQFSPQQCRAIARWIELYWPIGEVPQRLAARWRQLTES